MFNLLIYKNPSPETPDTGTFADGAIPLAMLEAQKTYRRLDGRAAFTRDYGQESKAQRAVQTAHV